MTPALPVSPADPRITALHGLPHKAHWLCSQLRGALARLLVRLPMQCLAILAAVADGLAAGALEPGEDSRRATWI